jgi:hypothetical protein
VLSIDPTYTPKKLTLKNIDGTTSGVSSMSGTLRTVDGAIFSVATYSNKLIDKNCNLENSGLAGRACFYVLVDTNGEAEPNMAGLDILLFAVQKKAVVPFGLPPYTGCKATCKDYNCLECTAKMINTGKIDW